MPDKNLTDKEIIKALEICSTYKGKCTDCPAFVKFDHSKCKQVLVGAIEIINRQQAEIEELKTAINGFRGYEDKIKAEAYKECIEKVEEIICDNTYPDFDINHKAVNIWKAEAYKNINNLLIEMESEKIEPEQRINNRRQAACCQKSQRTNRTKTF